MDDVLVGTLRDVIHALGGKLVVRAEFPDSGCDLEFGDHAGVPSPSKATSPRPRNRVRPWRLPEENDIERRWSGRRAEVSALNAPNGAIRSTRRFPQPIGCAPTFLGDRPGWGRFAVLGGERVRPAVATVVEPRQTRLHHFDEGRHLGAYGASAGI